MSTQSFAFLVSEDLVLDRTILEALDRTIWKQRDEQEGFSELFDTTQRAALGCEERWYR